MESKGSFPCSREPATGPYHKADGSSVDTGYSLILPSHVLRIRLCPFARFLVGWMVGTAASALKMETVCLEHIGYICVAE
jgi:hypothetical protein